MKEADKIPASVFTLLEFDTKDLGIRDKHCVYFAVGGATATASVRMLPRAMRRKAIDDFIVAFKESTEKLL